MIPEADTKTRTSAYSEEKVVGDISRDSFRIIAFWDVAFIQLENLLRLSTSVRTEKVKTTYLRDHRFIEQVYFDGPFQFRVVPDAGPTNFEDLSHDRARILT